jgi:hypothetical protein
MKTIFLAITITCSAIFAQTGVNYEVISVISKKAQPSPVKVEISSKNIDSLVKYSLDVTTSNLEFSLKSSGNSDVSTISKTGKAHCVGYARYFASVLTAALDKNKVRGYSVAHVRAKIHFLGFNLHAMFSDPAFKDHDICVITNTKTGEKTFVDPSLSEVLGDVIVKQ